MCIRDRNGSILAPIVFLAIYHLFSTIVRWYGLKFGYSLGNQFLETAYESGYVDMLTMGATTIGPVSYTHLPLLSRTKVLLSNDCCPGRVCRIDEQQNHKGELLPFSPFIIWIQRSKHKLRIMMNSDAKTLQSYNKKIY